MGGFLLFLAFFVSRALFTPLTKLLELNFSLDFLFVLS